MNIVHLYGRVGQAPELKYTANGKSVCNFSLATSKRWNDQAGQKQEKTEWHRVVAWGKQADVIAEHVGVGDSLLITGELQTRQWEDQNGGTRYSTEIHIDKFEFGSKSKKGEPEGNPDIPF
tara:strand:+ start:15145 stop:15507 length:363 start_codon:yes stop_codon:yes gene_type:complete